jgi:hypothetical protein
MQSIGFWLNNLSKMGTDAMILTGSRGNGQQTEGEMQSTEPVTVLLNGGYV